MKQALTLAAAFSLAACHSAAASGSAIDAGAADAAIAIPALARPPLCDRAGDDTVRDVFCADVRPAIGSLSDLEQSLRLRVPVEVTRELRSGVYLQGLKTTFPGVVLLAHSTALSGALVSALNPRAILFSYSTFLAFNRGVQQVELAAFDRKESHFNFYLVDFRQACNAAAGCSHGDLFTPRVESDWQEVTMRDAEDLKNTPSDCRQCHQRGRDDATLLMRELEGPWTHFFGPDQDEPANLPEPTGSALLRDFLASRPDEDYAGLPADLLRHTVGFTLEGVVTGDQPLVFDGSAILNERWPWAQGYPSEPQRSKTWYDAYDAFKRGEQLALPYFAPRVTDELKLQQLTAAYQRYRSGELAPEELPDLADVFPDDPQTRAEIGLQTEPGATPAQLLIQACGTCHNDVLDQSVSRARFSVAIGRLERSEVESAIVRIEAPRMAAGAMPPGGRRELDDDGRSRLIEWLRDGERSTADDEMLEHAAQRGMVGVVERGRSSF
jgi:mono/diheme cytochrome c family protein